ncbi:Transcriptional regulator/sugar kinase [Modestobacter italicus]|uniref:Transcriptional regulator/sugar kinase n=1 Tax=Modestobacter italicus (strain DSM 44449 / CECT 9708 / BC 501) TaxID=2732864 RepID=I4EXT2_MODI5|nr:ROK family protein [Modestobacter marinus]CCH88195.1 Transcriptional regulator/sugar kinase [Modestobacter marinus]
MSSSAPSPQESFIHGKLINLVRTGQAVTRPALEQETGLGRKVVTQRVQQAIDVGLLEDGDLAPSAGGRPSRLLRFRTEAGHVYAGMIGATEMTAAVATLDGTLVASLHEDWVAADRPDQTLEVLDALFVRLARRTRTEPWAFGIGVAGPVDFGTGRLVDPPIMPGWDGYSVRSWFRERYDAPVWVDNDVNLMALGEWHKGEPQDGRDLLYVFVDEGVGAGLVSRGSVFRGDTGAAGDIGHLQVTEDPAVQCRCGQTGCLEAVTGGWGLVRRLTERATESPVLAARLADHGRLTAEDVGLAARAGDPLAASEVDRGSRLIGATAANLVNFVNPGTVVLGGGALRVGERVFRIFEETLLRRTSKLAAQRLTVRPASLDFREGVTGAAILAIEQLFGSGAVGLWIEDGTPVGHAVPLHRTAVM